MSGAFHEASHSDSKVAVDAAVIGAVRAGIYPAYILGIVLVATGQAVTHIGAKAVNAPVPGKTMLQGGVGVSLCRPIVSQ